MKTILNDRKLLFLLIASVLSLTLEILSLTGIDLPMPYAPFLYAIFILSVGYHVLLDGFKALLKLRFSHISLLMLIAVAGAFYLGQYSEAAVVVILYVLGEYLEYVGIDKSKSALSQLISQSPKTALLKEAGQYIPIEEVEVGSLVKVKPHELIPLDGVVVAGETSVDEAAITGESLPKDKQVGDQVFAGTLNTTGFLEVRTTKRASDSTFAKIVELTFEAQANKSDSQKFIQRFARYYTPSILAIAILLFVVPTLMLGGDAERWLLQAITLLVIACPCALVISTPVAIYGALGNASSRGAMVKGGKYIESLAKVKVVGLDKTRTITYGTPNVTNLYSLNGYSNDELLAYAAGVEQHSEHPLAHAIVEEAKRQNIEPKLIEKFTSIVGSGASATCDRGIILVGKPSYIATLHMVDEEMLQEAARLAEQGKSSILVSIDGVTAGIIGLADKVKADSVDAIRQLKQLGIIPLMLTGDSEQAAKSVAREVGIERVYGNLLPQDKLDVVSRLLQQHKQVAMVGDGVNDAPALAQATVGIAMGAVGSDTAIEVANIALMNDRLSLVPYLIRLSKATVRTIKGNTIAAIGVKLIFVTLALAGMGNLVMAIVADVGVTIAVILISLRLLRFEGSKIKTTAGGKHKHSAKCEECGK